MCEHTLCIAGTLCIVFTYLMWTWILNSIASTPFLVTLNYRISSEKDFTSLSLNVYVCVSLCKQWYMNFYSSIRLVFHKIPSFSNEQHKNNKLNKLLIFIKIINNSLNERVSAIACIVFTCLAHARLEDYKQYVRNKKTKSKNIIINKRACLEYMHECRLEARSASNRTC